jgi:hypothetical protein
MASIAYREIQERVARLIWGTVALPSIWTPLSNMEEGAVVNIGFQDECGSEHSLTMGDRQNTSNKMIIVALNPAVNSPGRIDRRILTTTGVIQYIQD